MLNPSGSYICQAQRARLPLAPGMKELVQTSVEAAMQHNTDANTPSAETPVIFQSASAKDQLSSSCAQCQSCRTVLLESSGAVQR